MQVIVWLAIELFFFILAVIFKSSSFLGLALITIGAMVFFCAKQEIITGNKTAWIIAGFFLLFGAAIAIEPLIRKVTNWGEYYLGYVISIGLGAVFILLGMFYIFKYFLCKEYMEGVFECSVKYRSRGTFSYSPKFSYRYENKLYSNISGELYSEHKIRHKYTPGEKYPIYIHTKNPYVFRTKQAFPIFSLLWVILGVLFLCVPLLLFYYI